MWGGIRKAPKWQLPRATSVRLLWDERAAEAALEFLRDTRVGCMIALGAPKVPGLDSEEREEGGPSLP